MPRGQSVPLCPRTGYHALRTALELARFGLGQRTVKRFASEE